MSGSTAPAPTSPPSTSRSFSAYGREAVVASCARRILDAATICMARVTLAVLRTLLMRPRICLTLGNAVS